MLGAGLRLYRLGADDLSADEAAAWAAAAAPGLRAVAASQSVLDPGKLALYDFALHGWIGLFGDGVAAMRALSALLGTIAIVLVFTAAREVMMLGRSGADGRGQAELCAALAALICAVDLTLVSQARTVRMYPLMLAMELAQVACFARAAAAGRLPSLLGAAIFGAFAVAANFTAALPIAAETMWLGYAALARRGARSGATDGLYLMRPALALCMTMALLAPFIWAVAHTTLGAVHAGVLNWARLRPPWWPLETLRRASGKAPFLVLAPLAAYGGWRMKRGGGGVALGFLLWWMFAPLGLVMIASYAISPIEETRYVIASAVAFFILAAAGLAALDGARLRVALAALVVVLSLDHVRRDFSKPQFAQWRAAAALALAAAGPDGRIAVAPAYAVNVVRYYLPRARRAAAEGAAAACDSRQRVLILGGKGIIAPAQAAALKACDPVIVARPRQLEVRKR